MRILKMAALIAVAALGVSACSSDGNEPEAEVEETVAEETVAEPEEETATTAQVASVIAQYEPDWREISENSLDCYGLNTNPIELADGLNGLACQSDMRSMTLQAQIVLNELDGLVIPGELESLVAETIPELEEVAAYNDVFDEACSDQSAPVNDDCATAIRDFGYLASQFERVLNKWQPYMGGAASQAEEETTSATPGASITREEAYASLDDGLASGVTPGQWDGMARTVCRLLEVDSGDAVATAQRIWDMPQIRAIDPELITIQTDELGSGHMVLLLLVSTQLECPEYQHAVADASEIVAGMR